MDEHDEFEFEQSVIFADRYIRSNFKTLHKMNNEEKIIDILSALLDNNLFLKDTVIASIFLKTTKEIEKEFLGAWKEV